MFNKIVLLLACCCGGLQASSLLIVGTNAEFPPYSFIENRKIVGFDIEVVNEVAKRLGKNIQFKDMPFDALIPEVILGRVDLVAAGISYTEERAKRVCFTQCYLNADPLVVFSTAKEKALFNELAGKTVVVVEGFTSDQLMSSKKEVHLMRLNNQADAFIAVKCGRAQAFVTAKSTVEVFFENQDPSQFHIDVVEGTGETCAMIVPKSKPEILEQVQNALDSMESDGTMDILKAKWKLS
jgi:arginine/lysine/histidine transporter system substrate-binding protein